MKKQIDKRVIPFSPPDITEDEILEVAKTLESGWITTGPRTKLLERRLAAFIDTGRTDRIYGYSPNMNFRPFRTISDEVLSLM